LLLQDVRGSDKRPGEFRTIQNFISRRGDRIEDARFVPPPPAELPGLLADFERALAQPGALPPLVRIALVHYQFEAIHPFIDGNGRVGRLLIPLLLAQWGVMRFPQLLQLSDEIDRDRTGYLDGLLQVSRRGDWAGWLGYFLDAARVQANRAARLGAAVLDLRERYRASLQAEGGTARLLRLVDDLFERPTLTANRAADRLGVSYPTAQRQIDHLVAKGFLTEVTGKQRNRVYLASPILNILNADPA
jgi:Fic family protein